MANDKLNVTCCFSRDTDHVQDIEGRTWRITHEQLHHTESHQLQNWVRKGGGGRWVMIKTELRVEFHGTEASYQPFLSLQETICQPPWPFPGYVIKTPVWDPVLSYSKVKTPGPQ